MSPFNPATADLEPPVRALVGSPDARVLTWKRTPVAWRVVSEVTGGLHRLSGTYEDGGLVKPWSLVLKVNRRPPGEVGEAWRREELAYTSGILHPQKGFAVARLLAVTRPSEDEAWLWLEDVLDEGGDVLSVERHALAARHLGVFNGAHPLDPSSVPGWLLQDWLPGLLPLPEPDAATDLVRQAETWRHPAVRMAFPEFVLGRLERLSTEASEVLGHLAALPVSLCHLDAGRFNLCVRRGRSDRGETVLLDWQMLAAGPLGSDLAMMNALNLCRFYVHPDEAARHDALTLSAYLDGLRDAGAAFDPAEVRSVYRTAAALRAAAIVRVVVHGLATRGFERTPLLEWGERWRWNRDETLRAWGRSMRFLLELGDE